MQLYRFNNRRWFSIGVGILIALTLIFSFALIFGWLPGRLNILWEVLRLVLAFAVMTAWVTLNMAPLRPTGFIIALADLGEEKAENSGMEGEIRAARSGLLSLLNRQRDAAEAEATPDTFKSSHYLAELKALSRGAPAGAIAAGKIVSQLPAGTPALKPAATALAVTERAKPTPSRPPNGAALLNGVPAPSPRAASQPAFLSEFGEEEIRPTGKIKYLPPANFFEWENVAGASDISEYLPGTLKTELGELELNEAVTIYPLQAFVRTRDQALREAEVPKANMVIWGWKTFGKRRDYVPVFEMREPLENNRPGRGQMQIIGLRSFDLGVQNVKHGKIMAAFVTGLGAYGYAGGIGSKDDQLYYQKAKSAFNLALIASYMHDAQRPREYPVERAIIYFFLANTYYYLNDLDNSANAYREALMVDSEMIEARHNMGVVLFMQRKYDVALKSLIRVIQQRPNLAVARLNLGVAYLSRQQFIPARRELQNVIRLDAKSAAAYRILGVSYRDERDYSRAVEFLLEALKVSPAGKYAEARVDLALVYAQQAQSDEIEPSDAEALYERATAQLQQAIADNPALPEAHYHLAQLYSNSGMDDEAGAALLEAVRLRYNYSEAHELLAEIYEKRGRFDLRDKHLELMMRARQASSANTPEEHVRQGIGFRLTKNYEQARQELEKALKMEPRNIKALFELGIVYQELDEPDRALSAYQTVLKLPSPPTEVYNRIALIKFQQDDRQGALDLLRQAVANEPANPKLHYYLGNAYRKQKTDGKAIESYIKAIQLEPEMVEPHFNLGMIYLTRKQINDAILQFKEVVRLRPEDYDTQYFLGRAYRQNNQIDEAVAALEEAVSLKSDLLEARLLLGEIYLRRAEPDRAIEQLGLVQTYNPNDLRARELMGKAFAQAGQLDRAIETFQDIIAVAPDSVSAHYNLGVSYVSQRRYKDAIIEFSAVIQNKPDDADGYFNLGVAIHELLNGNDGMNLESGQIDNFFQQEVEAFQRAIQLRPTFPESYRYLGQLYTRINDMQTAMKYLNEYNRLKRQS